MMGTPITSQAVAEWMLGEVEEHGYLYQETAVREIKTRFGDEFVYRNENHNPAIARKVLAAFRKLSDDSVVWERSAKNWRRRVEGDGAARRQW